MYINDNTLWIIAREREQQFLREAELSRTIQILKQRKPKRAKLRQRLTWRLGGLMIIWGHRLQLNQEQRWA